MFSNFSALFKKVTRNGLFRRDGGFGLIELMVSISIMVIVSGIILSRQSAFNSAVLLRSQAYEVALRIREVQLNAVSASADGTGNFRSILGIYFDKTPGTNQVYKIFKDDGDGVYDPLEEFDLQGRLDSRFEFREIRTIEATPSIEDGVSVIFVRPNFDAQFFNESGGVLSGTGIQIDIAIVGKTGTGDDVLRTVEVTSTGQIAVI